MKRALSPLLSIALVSPRNTLRTESRKDAPYKNPNCPSKTRGRPSRPHVPREKAAMLSAPAGWRASLTRWEFPPSNGHGPMGVRNWAGSSRSQTHRHGPVLATAFPRVLAWEQAGCGTGPAGGQVIAQEVKALDGT